MRKPCITVTQLVLAAHPIDSKARLLAPCPALDSHYVALAPRLWRSAATLAEALMTISGPFSCTNPEDLGRSRSHWNCTSAIDRLRSKPSQSGKSKSAVGKFHISPMHRRIGLWTSSRDPVFAWTRANGSKKNGRVRGTTPLRAFAVDRSLPVFVKEPTIASSPASVRSAGAEPRRPFALSCVAASA